MKKINIIKKSDEINSVISSKNLFKNKYYYIYNKENNLGKTRFCICVSKKIGNAVTRNKNKRQVKDIIDKSNLMFKSNTDYVIILGREINKIDYETKRKELIELFSKNL